MSQKIKNFFFVFLLFFLFFYQSYAYTLEEVRVVYDKFIVQLDTKVKNEKKQIQILEWLAKNIDTALNKSKQKKQITLLSHLKTLNNKKILLLKSQQNVKQVQQQQQQFLNATQLPVSQNILENAPSFIQNLTKKYPFYALNNSFEYSQEWKVFRVNIKKHYKLDQKQGEYFLKNPLENAVILYLPNDQYILTWEFIQEEKIPYNELKKLFVYNIEQWKNPIFLESGVYYGWGYKEYYYFDDPFWLYLSDLKKHNIDFEKTLFIDANGEYHFTNNYKKTRLIDEKNLINITNKQAFLEAILDDNRFASNNYDEIFTHLEKTVHSLVSHLKTDQEKIYAIHKYIVDSVEYYQNYKDGSTHIFSWILTYQNKSWVCDGYVKLMLYMLSFAQIQDVEIKRGFAYDNQDFPDFWHAWIRVWNNYYDPTFDDPIWNTSVDKTDFLYFNLPKEVIYTNRFDGLEIPESLKNMSLEERKIQVLKNMYQIYDQYSQYPILQKISNRKYLWISYDEEITLDTLIQKLGVYEVKNFMLLVPNASSKRISSGMFYQFDQNTIDVLFSQSKIDIKNMMLLKWYHQDGTFEYRLAYNLEFFWR